jgi:hypothetical protein
VTTLDNIALVYSQGSPSSNSQHPLDVDIHRTKKLHTCTKSMEILKQMGKSKKLSFVNLNCYEKMCFGSWGTNEEIQGENHLSDFLPNL